MPDVPISSIRAEDMAMDLKCVVSVPVVRFLQDKLGEEQTMRLVAQTGMSLSYLSNPNNWISLDYFCRLLDKLVEETGDSMAPFYAAQRYSDIDSYKGVGFLLKHLGTPRQFYGLIVRFHSLWDRICEYRMLEVRRNSCAIEVRFLDRKQQKNNCLALLGSLSAVPAALGLPYAKVVENQCVCEGAVSCVYEMQWVNLPERVWALRCGVSGFVLGAGFVAVMGGHPLAYAVMSSATGAAGYFLGRGIDYRRKLTEVHKQNEGQAAALLESLRDIEALNRSLRNQVEERTAELSEANANLRKAYEDLKASQEKALIAEKQAAFGILAASMAHDMNNPLGAVTLALQMLEEDTACNDTFRPIVETAKRATIRCRRIIGEMLCIGREPRRETQADLRDILDASLALFETEHPDGIAVNRFVAPGFPTVLLDKPHIQQVVLNLLANALDASGGRGAVNVRLERIGDDAVLSVQDYGCGMDEAVLKRIFDPLFTTKTGTQKGLGLGLSIAYQLVQRNGGTIEAASTEGQGATFTVRFPIKTGAGQEKAS